MNWSNISTCVTMNMYGDILTKKNILQKSAYKICITKNKTSQNETNKHNFNNWKYHTHKFYYIIMLLLIKNT